MTRVPQDPLRPGRTRRSWPLIDPIQGYNISKNCDDASPRFFVRLDSIWGFCVFGANWEGTVGSPTAWKNKRPRPVTVLIPGYNICKICDDARLIYFRRIFWKSLFRHFPDSPICRIWGVLPSSPTACRDLMGTPNCWYDHYLWYMSKLRWRKS